MVACYISRMMNFCRNASFVILLDGKLASPTEKLVKKFPSQGCITFLSFPDYKDCMPLAVLLSI